MVSSDRVQEEDCLFCRLLAADDANIVRRMEAGTLVIDVDQRYRGKLTLVADRHVEDFDEFEGEEAAAFMRDLRRSIGVVKLALRPDKLNYMILGNVVTHLHWHIWPRRRGDDGWGGPPRLSPEPARIADAEMRTLRETLRTLL